MQIVRAKDTRSRWQCH